jgi:hypothetical protein
MAVNKSAIRSLLEPGLALISGEYERKQTIYSKLFKVKKATKGQEYVTQMRFLGLPALKTEGAQTTMDNNAGQRYTYNAVVQTIGLGYSITAEAQEDNQYKSDFKAANLGLMDSFAEMKETLCANILNDGTTYNATVGGDGVALFSTAHPMDGGTWANRFSTDLDLSESALEQGTINIRSNFKNEAGLRINAMPRKLVVPVALQFTAERLIKSELRPGTANNDVNAMRTSEGGIREYIVHDYLTSARAWFVMTNIDGLALWERRKFETQMFTDDFTDNLYVKASERYIPMHHDPRCAYGSFPTS